ncbi:ubiquitin hydrolase [Trypanosoma theileri]|uniref:ubiquitinyl hydrolase 1 n=1 Tax=Trypanosoma theileri TaxID=67003 RepID=A0A1X0NUI1_9TRYP|nr:ubiquitin hydrolase [Trypanosoma theileri]ORC88366.1 ubiquitin hydrolase [Trypanosoma theileri]
MASTTVSGPPGSMAATPKTRKKGRGGGNNSTQKGSVKSTDIRNVAVVGLNLEDVYISLVTTSTSSSSSQKIRHGPFVTVFSHPPPARGVINNSNFCFINAILQALVFTPPFAQLAVSAISVSEMCPLLSTLGKWFLSYWTKPAMQSIAPPRLSVMTNTPTTSSSSSTHLGVRRMDGTMQEDAPEFLHRILETIRSELCGLEQHCRDSGLCETDKYSLCTDSVDTKGWTFVKGKEKLSVREHSEEGRSILFDSLFGGTLESHLKGKSKTKNFASVVVESFFVLQIDVCFGADCSLEVALERTLQTERVHDDAREKDLLKTLKLRQLPNVLFLQLRRWAVTAEGEYVKLDNIVRFSKTLVLPKSTCSDATLSNSLRTYDLVSFIAHRGRATERGHYVTYLTNAATPGVRTEGGNDLLTLCNDAKITTVTMREALETEAVYFLVYMRRR